MLLSEFTIGTEFRCSESLWRCTDIGTRVVVAIRIDEVTEGSAGGTRRVLSRQEAAAAGWFAGPPYATAESVFDEDDLEACSLKRDE